MKKDRRLRHLALALALTAAPLAGVAACSPYAIVQQSGPPSALQGQTSMTVGFDWSQVQVLDKTEAAYLAEKSEEERADFAKIKQETDAAILQGLGDRGGIALSPAAGDAPPDLVVQYVHVQTGIYTPVFSLPSKLSVRFAWQRDGKPTDIIDTSATIGASLTTPSDHQRMEMAGRQVGKAGARFMAEAQGK